jgi:hypothetical protein
MSNETYSGKLRALENFHIVLWLIKDFCWCMLWCPLGIVMIAPTLFFALYITFKSRNIRVELFHNLAVVMWILANSTWMLGEFYYNDQLRNFALVFFIFGLLIVTYYYMIAGLTRKRGKKA